MALMLAQGLHRHFRMISIYQNLRTAAYDLDVEGEMTTQSIWGKLESLYHLESLNERVIRIRTF